MSRGDWTEEELAALRRHYRKEGPGWDGWYEVLPGKSYWQIHCMARKLGLCDRKASRRWTREEDEALVRMVEEGASARECARAIPGRSEYAVERRMQRLGIAGRGFGDEDDARLLTIVDEVAARTHRPAVQVAGRMLLLARRRAEGW